MNAGARSQESEVRTGTSPLGPAKSFEQLIVWQRAHQFVLAVYRITENFSRHEIYGLTSQFRRAAVSIPANIAESFKKRSSADKARFFNIAQGSLEEYRYYLILAKDLNYSGISQFYQPIEEISRMLGSSAAKILAAGS